MPEFQKLIQDLNKADRELMSQTARLNSGLETKTKRREKKLKDIGEYIKSNISFKPTVMSVGLGIEMFAQPVIPGIINAVYEIKAETEDYGRRLYENLSETVQNFKLLVTYGKPLTYQSKYGGIRVSPIYSYTKVSAYLNDELVTDIEYNISISQQAILVKEYLEQVFSSSEELVADQYDVTASCPDEVLDDVRAFLRSNEKGFLTVEAKSLNTTVRVEKRSVKGHADYTYKGMGNSIRVDTINGQECVYYLTSSGTENVTLRETHDGIKFLWVADFLTKEQILTYIQCEIEDYYDGDEEKEGDD